MIARGPHAAERRGARCAGQRLVPVDDSGARFHQQAVEQRPVWRHQPYSQPEASVVGETQRIIELVIARHAGQRTEILFVRHAIDAGDIEDARHQQCVVILRPGHRQQRRRAQFQQCLLYRHHAFRRLRGNYPAHKRLRLRVPATSAQATRHGDQPLQEGVARRAALDQQTTGTGATLPGGDKGGLDSQVDRRVHVGNLIDNQCVVAAHLQRQNFFRLTGQLAVQLVAGTGAAGEQQAVDRRAGGQRLASVPSSLHQIQHALRQSGLLPQLNCLFSGERRQLAWFEHHAVTRQ